MRIAITGASGFIGSKLSESLSAQGHDIVSIGRGPANDIPWDPGTGTIDGEKLVKADAVVHLAGENIGGDRMLGRQWDREKKTAIKQSRIDGTSLIANTMADLTDGPRVLVTSSAIGFYGDRGDEVLTESSGPGSNFHAEVCQAWESASSPAVHAGIRTVITRTGVVVSDDAEAFRRLLLPFRLGGGGPLGSGRQWWSLVSMSDVIRAISTALLDDSISGPINVTGPEPIRNRDLARLIGARLGRPALIPAPAPALRALLGSEFVDNVLLASTRVIPNALTERGFEFSHPRVEDMLASEVR
jgi:uncharacterized protein (TIGR01777 family)